MEMEKYLIRILKYLMLKSQVFLNDRKASTIKAKKDQSNQWSKMKIIWSLHLKVFHLFLKTPQKSLKVKASLRTLEPTLNLDKFCKLQAHSETQQLILELLQVELRTKNLSKLKLTKSEQMKF